jgi:hypothetical protein
MSKLLGVFDLLLDLDKITDQELLDVLKSKIDHHSLENYLGNRVLFPQTVATNKLELDIDFAILEVAVKRHPETIFKSNQNQIIIPYPLIPRFPNTNRLITSIMDSLHIEQVSQLWIKHHDHTELIGSILPAKPLSKQRSSDLENFMVKEELKKLILGQINLLPIADKQVKLKFSNGIEFDCFGGSFGVLMDLRFAK